jgi:hypothetical protein
MNFSIRAIIRVLAAPEHRLSCSNRLWAEGIEELRRRGKDVHESGAFVLGTVWRGRRQAVRFVYYDDLDPGALATGIVVFDGSGYGPLWQICRQTGFSVIADLHTHATVGRQSPTDKVNPMIAKPGHIAIVVPNLARRAVRPGELGIYEYAGQHCWREFVGAAAERYFYVGRWG